MHLLLDTHIYLWILADDKKLTKAARKMILEADEIYISSATIWEASIKARLGKLDVDVDSLVAEIKANGFNELPVRAVHAARVRDLPDIHRDPFDRILIAQAMSEPMQLLTADRNLSEYSELVLVV